MIDGRSIVIKRADKGSCVAVWDRHDYLRETVKQLGNQNMYRKIAFKNKMFSQLADCSNKFFKNLKMKENITKKELKYFSYEFEKSCNLGNFTCYTKHTKKHSSKTFLVNQWFLFFARQLRSCTNYFFTILIKSGKSYLKDSGHFLEKIKYSRMYIS